VGDIFVLVRKVCSFSIGPKKKPIDVILIHLAFSNSIIICSIGVRDIATNLYFLNFLGGVGCKIVVYLGRVAGGLSICTTCLLSVVQAVTISPRTTLWRSSNHRLHGKCFPISFSFDL
jgi:vomeronasal1 receptor